MIEQVGNAITFYAQFLVSGAAGTGLTVTCTVYLGSDGSTIVSAQPATEIGGGLYKYTLASGSVGTEDDYLAVFNEALATADQTDVPSLWTVGHAGIENLDAAASSLATTTALGVVDGNVDDIETLLTALDVKHDATDVALAVVDGNVDDIETLLTALDVKHDATDVALAVVDGNVDDIETLLTALDVKHDATDVALAVVDGNVDDIETLLGTWDTGSATVVFVGPVSADAGTLTLVRADSYTESLSRAIQFDSTTWPDLTGATITMTIRRRIEAFGSGSDSVLVTVTDKSASRVVGVGAQTVVFELSATNTLPLLPGTSTGKFDVQSVLTDNTVITIASGLVTVVEDQTR
jgi:hypothetical protein